MAAECQQVPAIAGDQEIRAGRHGRGDDRVVVRIARHHPPPAGLPLPVGIEGFCLAPDGKRSLISTPNDLTML